MFSFNCKKLYLSKLAGSNHFKVARLQVAIAGLGRDAAHGKWRCHRRHRPYPGRNRAMQTVARPTIPVAPAIRARTAQRAVPTRNSAWQVALSPLTLS